MTKCKHERLLEVDGKVSDTFSAYLDGHDYNGYVPNGMGIGMGDYISFSICADCGQVPCWKPIEKNILAPKEV